MKNEFYNRLIENNKEWVKARLAEDDQFFSRLEKQQAPPLLWIGCSDSRVPANQIIGADPGEVFVHRNIANVVVHSDMNLLSVMDYSVNVLKVKHIVVCGHYGCGGVKAAMGTQNIGIIDNWIRHIRDVYRFHKRELDAIENDNVRFDRLVELNVKEQVGNVVKTSIVQKAWENGQELHVHGWVYGLKDGLIKDLDLTISDNNEVDEVFRLEF